MYSTVKNSDHAQCNAKKTRYMFTVLRSNKVHLPTTIRVFSKCTKLVMSAFFVLLKCEHILEIAIPLVKFDSMYSVKKLIVPKFI